MRAPLRLAPFAPTALALTLAFSLALPACSNEATEALPPREIAAPARPAAPAPAGDDDGDDDDGDGERGGDGASPTDAPRGPTLTLREAKADGFGALRVTGKVEDAREPASFFLHTATGCAHEAKLVTTTTGIGFSVELGAAALTDALGCAIDAQLGDELLQTLSVSPGASVVSGGSPGLALDPVVSLVRASLDPADGDMIRLAVTSASPVTSASLSLRGASYRARVTLEGDADVPATALVEVPARVWAEAILDGTHGWFDVRGPAGAAGELEIAPEVSVEVMAIGDDEGC